MKIGSLELKRTAALAPMAGVADSAFRQICKEFGACYLVAVRQGKFGFQTKLPGRKRPSSGVFSGFQPEARFARRPLSLPYGRGVGDPSP